MSRPSSASTNSRSYVVIPARYASTRLPRKMLLRETGKSLLQHTYEAARAARRPAGVLVATDHVEIACEVDRFRGDFVMTSPDCSSGTDRVAEVARKLPRAEILVNVQGDEPELSPGDIDLLVKTLGDSPRAEMATLATPIRDPLILADAACVKVVCAADKRALYFSRAAIPHVRDAEDSPAVHERYATDSPWLLHIGVYAYRREFLLAFTDMPPGRLERLEKLEQLRALEAGAPIQVAIIPHASVGIDTREDYARFVERQQERS